MITCLAQNPPELGASVFHNVNKETCTLKVPLGTYDVYHEADQWKDFLLMEETTGIETIDNEQWTIDNSDCTIYTLDGQQVKNLQKGVNIVRPKDGKIVKVLKK